MAKWVNTVPQGIAGTGNATIYGVNPVAAQFGNQLALLRERESQQALLQQKEAEKLAQSFRDNQLESESGMLWAQDVGKLEQDHYQKGIDLTQRGIDPYGLSIEGLNYRKERGDIKSKRGYRKATESSLNEANKLVQANPGKYDQESIRELNDFYKTKLLDGYAGNLSIPQLRERYSPGAAVKDLKAITQNDVDVKGNVKSDKKFLDKEATENMIIGRFMSDPRGIEFLNKMSGGIPINELRKMPKTIEANREAVINEYNGSRQLRQKLASEAGIVGEGEKFNQWVDEMARVRTSSKNSFDNQMDSYVANASNGMMLWDRNTPDFSIAKNDQANRSLNIRQQNANKQPAGEGVAVDEPKDLTLYYGGKNSDGSQPSVTGVGTVNISMAGKNFHGSPAISLSSGKPTKITEASNDYQVVSASNYPILTKTMTIKKSDGTSETLKAGSLVQDTYASKYPDNVEYKPMLLVQKKIGTGSSTSNFLVDSKYMPKNLTKNEKAVFDSFKPMGAKPKPTVTKTTTFKNIPKGGF